MRPKKGDLIAFNYFPSFLPQQVYCRTRILRVKKQNHSVLVRVWNGLTIGSVQYEEIEINWCKIHLIEKRKNV